MHFRSAAQLKKKIIFQSFYRYVSYQAQNGLQMIAKM